MEPTRRRCRGPASALALGGALALGSALMAALFACDAAPRTGGEAAVEDSAGVRIVTSPLPDPSPDGWRVEPEPFLTLGTAQGDPAQEFSFIRGVRRMPDGTVVVADGLTQELRFFDPDADHRATAGGRGDGPGEFQALLWILLLPEGTVAATDAASGRVTEFSSDGRVVSSWSLTSEDRFPPPPRVALPDGRFVAWSEPFPGGLEEGFTALELEQMVLVYDGRDTPAREIVREPGRDAFFHFDGQGVSNLLVPFGRDGRVAATGDRVYQGNGTAWEIRGYDLEGALREILRLDAVPRPVTPELLRRMRDARLEAVPNDEVRARSAERFDRAPVPGTMPAYGDFLTDPDGRLWVQVYAPDQEPTRQWIVFDEEGRAAGSLELPGGLQVRQFTGDAVVGTVTDALGVEQVRLHRLLRPGEGTP